MGQVRAAVGRGRRGHRCGLPLLGTVVPRGEGAPGVEADFVRDGWDDVKGCGCGAGACGGFQHLPAVSVGPAKFCAEAFVEIRWLGALQLPVARQGAVVEVQDRPAVVRNADRLLENTQVLLEKNIMKNSSFNIDETVQELRSKFMVDWYVGLFWCTQDDIEKNGHI